MAKNAYRIYRIDLDDENEYAYGECVEIVLAKGKKKAFRKALGMTSLDSGTKFTYEGREYSIDYFEKDKNGCGTDGRAVLMTDCFCLFESDIFNDWAHFAR